MNMKILIGSVVGFMMNLVDARISFGTCQDVENVKNLDIYKFKGMWYQIERDGLTPRHWFTDCNYRKYAIDDNKDLDFYYGIYYDLGFSY